MMREDLREATGRQAGCEEAEERRLDAGGAGLSVVSSRDEAVRRHLGCCSDPVWRMPEGIWVVWWSYAGWMAGWT